MPIDSTASRLTKFLLWFSAAGMLLSWGAYVYFFRALRVAGNDVGQLSAESVQLEHQQSEILTLKRDLEKNQARQPILVSYFVDASDPVPLFETLEGYGRTTGTAVSINAAELKRGPDRLIVTLTATGAFPDIYRFLALLEAAPYEFSVGDTTIRMASASGKNAASSWEARVTLSIASVSGANTIPIK